MRKPTSGVLIFAIARSVGTLLALSFCALVACSTSSGGLSNDQACTDQAKARCAKTQECSTYWWRVRFGADLNECLAIEKQYCASAIAAPSSAKTAQGVEDCIAADATYTCPDWLANRVPAACVPKSGSLGNAATCAFNAQCASGFCEVPQSFACGRCTPPTKVGDSCASSGQCATETTGQYCAAATSICSAPVPQGGTCDNVALLCEGGLNCAGSSPTSNGTCQLAVTTLGADCVATSQGGAGCDRHHGLQCDVPTKKCVPVTFSPPGGPCGTVNNYAAFCDNGGFCNIPTGQKSGACVAVAADGAACDTANGPSCAYRSSCIVSTGTTGTCMPIGKAACP